jgi:hypothetical protein
MRLFQPYKESKMTWLELYNFLHEQANSISKHGTFDWQGEVKVYDAANDELNYCDTYFLTDEKTKVTKFVLMTNVEKD